MLDDVLSLNSNFEKIRVCIFTTVHLPDDVRVFHRECKSLVNAGYDVHLVVPCEKSQSKDGVQIHAIRRVKSRLVRMTVMTWVAMYEALRTKATIYHFHPPEMLFVGFLMRWVFFKKVVFDMRESISRQIMAKEYLPKWSRKIASLCYRVIENICLKGIAVIVANDRSIEENEPCYLVRNFPDIDEDLMAEAVEMNKRLQQPMLVYLGGVWENRGAFIYIDLAHGLAERGHDFRMMIIGPHEEQFGQKLNARIREVGLQDKVLVPGLMDYREAMKIVSRAAIGLALLKPTPNHLFCLAGKMIEYMMCGTPVLCSNFDHWRPYIEGEHTGMMADPDNMDEIIDVCEKMLNNPDELAAMGRRGMEAVRTKYNWEVEFKVLLQCYDDLLKSST